MIPAIVTATPVASGPGSVSSPAASEAAGTSFGNAVKDVGRDHAERQDKGQDKANDAKGPASETGAKTERKRAHANGDDKDAGTAGEDGNAVPSAADILGKLFGVSMPREANNNEKSETSKNGKDEGDGELQERLVISTVMDLAGEAEAKDTAKGKVSLRVLKMETHFEPRIDGATLVDPETAATELDKTMEALVGGSAAKDGAETGTGLRKGFEEILQGLGRPASETAPQGESDGQGGTGGDRRGDNKAVAAKAADKTAASEAARSFTPAKSVNNPGEPASTTGQLISTQVAGRIVEAFSSDRTSAATSSAPANASNAQLLRMTAGGAAMKTLSIQLQPQDLGRLDVSMRLIDGRLSVELAASEPSTAQALAGDRHTLRKLLEHAGFALDDAAITIVARDVGQISQSASSGNGQGDTQNGGSERGQGRAFEGSGSGGQGSASGERRGEGGKPEDTPDRRPPRTAGNVFL